MKTGTDINLYTCRAEGYPVVEHGKRPLDVNKDYRLTISNPHNWTDNGKAHIYPTGSLYVTDTLISYVELWEIFQREGPAIQSFSDFENCPIPSPTDDPTFFDFVSLAGVIHAYCGIE